MKRVRKKKNNNEKIIYRKILKQKNNPTAPAYAGQKSNGGARTKPSEQNNKSEGTDFHQGTYAPTHDVITGQKCVSWALLKRMASRNRRGTCYFCVCLFVFTDFAFVFFLQIRWVLFGCCDRHCI